MNKVIVIGSPGSGKSYFSKKLSKITNLPLFHMDLLYHNKDGTHITREELKEKLTEICKKDKWIIDGNYQKTLEIRMQACDTIYLLDFPVDVCLEGATSRIGTKRDDLPWEETSLDENFKQCIVTFPKEKLPEIYNLLQKYKDTKEIIIFKTREEIYKYLQTLK